MSGQAGIDSSSLDISGVGAVQSSKIDSSFSSVGNEIDSTLTAQYQGSFADIGVTGAQVSSTYQSTVQQATSTTATSATYESSFSVTASQGRGEVSTNVSAFIEPENAYILGIIADLGINDDMAEEMRLELIMNLLANNFAYEPDSAGEAWNTVNETLSTKSGDCEDLSNLAASLLLAAGFPAEDVNVYVDLQANGAQGHVVVGIMMNDQEVKLDVAQLITDKDGNYAQINESFYANNQLNKSSYDFSYSVNGVEKLNVNLSSNIVMEDANNADSYYTAAVPLPLPSFMSFNEQDSTYTINGTHGKDTFNFTKSGNGILLTYNNVPYYLTRDYGVAATAQMTVRGGGGGDILEKAAGIDVTDLLEAEIQPPSSLVVVAADGNSITITGGATADNIDLTKDANGHNILTYKANGTTFIYDLTRLYHDKAINIDSGAGNDTITVKDVAVNSITMGDGANNVTLDGSSTVNSITGGVGVDTITLKGASKVTGEINAGAGNDSINIEGTASVNLISGGAGVDTITLKGNSKVNAIDAGMGADVISLKESAISTSIVGGDGNDIITLTNSSRAGAISGGNGDDTITLSLNSMAHGISGGEGNDTILLQGTSQSNYIEGDAGNDKITLDGGKVNILNGGTGADTIKVQTTGHANSITDDIADHLSLTATNPTGGNATYGYFPTSG
ncbi:MAG: calcium-binding protein, partial [Candidatus Riflemargulisbacteria bacterium]